MSEFVPCPWMVCAMCVLLLFIMNTSIWSRCNCVRWLNQQIYSFVFLGNCGRCTCVYANVHTSKRMSLCSLLTIVNRSQKFYWILKNWCKFYWKRFNNLIVLQLDSANTHFKNLSYIFSPANGWSITQARLQWNERKSQKHSFNSIMLVFMFMCY